MNTGDNGKRKLPLGGVAVGAHVGIFGDSPDQSLCGRGTGPTRDVLSCGPATAWFATTGSSGYGTFLKS
ncbi:hypothetical protein ACIRU3_41055 [Streptomyces sp. NPDC101151]|uniref:hypothetical protein n=1 Tax=Streptomyces sp. NPDC101151 TaxID=3366115 RepID=UPI003821301C